MRLSDRKFIRQHTRAAQAVLNLSAKMRGWSDGKLQAQTAHFKRQLARGSNLDALLIPAFATAHEAARRITGLEIYLVQVIGAIVLHQGDLAEMKTGEGKTITSVLPAYLNGLTSKGVHIITVNAYLAKRDFEYIGAVLKFLKLTVGLNLREATREMKRAAFAQDVTYSTNSELGFDYLRDNMTKNAAEMVLRGLNFAIIDEADSVLIDEARTPLIISGGKKALKFQYQQADQFAKSLQATFKADIELDRETRQISLSVTGVEKAETFFGVKSLFSVSNTTIYHSILNALRANFVFKNGIEYLVRDGEIVLIDQHTGRLMEGRSYSDGLQQAIQAKEGVEIEDETITLGTITYQNLFRLYSKLSGMTGTAKTEEEEFIKIYNMRVIVVPTNRPVIRKDESDLLFTRQEHKLKHLIKEVMTLHKAGRPILIGTTSVQSSETVSRHLQKAHLPHEVLNAKNHKREAEIIAKAGQAGAITISTNMAGRGTDIKLGSGIAAKGGLAVLGIGRNEARRIDNQLRGRSGRQGDPGVSRFYVSLDDDLMKRFGAQKLEKSFGNLGEDFIRSRMLTRGVTTAQKRIEGLNFDQRKNLLDYDNVLAQHREAIYAQRTQILKTKNLLPMVKKMMHTLSQQLIREHEYQLHGEVFLNLKALVTSIENKVIFVKAIDPERFKNSHPKEITRLLTAEMWDFFTYRMSDVPLPTLTEVIRKIIVNAIDNYWQQHIDVTQKLRHSVYLRSYAQNNPLFVYVKEASRFYNYMKVNVAKTVIAQLGAVVISAQPPVTPQRDLEQTQVKIGG